MSVQGVPRTRAPPDRVGDGGSTRDKRLRARSFAACQLSRACHRRSTADRAEWRARHSRYPRRPSLFSETWRLIGRDRLNRPGSLEFQVDLAQPIALLAQANRFLLFALQLQAD